MTLILALQERRDRVRAGVQMQAEQDIVVAVEDGNEFGGGQLRSFGS